MARERLERQMIREIDKLYSNDRTAQAYKAGARDFSQYAREHGIKRLENVSKEHIQSYERSLEERGLSPATIHARIAPICRLREVNMREVEHPRRTSDRITRGRDAERNAQGRRQERDTRYEMSINLERAIGVRRAEMERLRGDDLRRDENGHLCVHVERGKGGKEHLQRILPEHEKTVLEAFKRVRGHEYVLDRSEIAPKANYHGIRAQVAREAYEYYRDRLEREPGYREELRRELMDRYDASGTRSSRSSFREQVYDDEPYKLRGANKEKALELGNDVVLDRTAVMAVSVFQLSHWRPGVTVVNYLNT